MPPTLELTEPRTGRRVAFEPRRLVVAGFTGRDREQVERHVRELEAIGVTRPATVPAFYELPVDNLTTATSVEVDSSRTSGEVEPVLVCTPAGWYVTVGSDHTDRDTERHDIAAAKRRCPKPLSSSVIPYEAVREVWDEIDVRAAVMDGGRERVVQHDRLSALCRPEDIVARLRTHTGAGEDGLVVFLGTVPLAGESFAFGERFRCELRAPGWPVLRCAYEVVVRTSGDRDDARKG